MCNRFKIITLILLSVVFVACHKQKPTPRIPQIHQQESVSPLEDIIYCTSESPEREVTINENGEEYSVSTVGGQMLIFFKEHISHTDALTIIENNHAKVIAQIPYLKYYLVETTEGQEGDFFSHMRSVYDVDFVYPNVIEYICSVSSIVLDNYYSDHGKMVAAMMQGCEPLKNITHYDIGMPESERTVNPHKAIEDVEKSLRNMRNEDGAVFNMSFGPSLIKLWAVIPWQHRVLWNDDHVTEGNKRSYKRKYINHLKTWVELAERYNDKDFVFVKSIGNEGMKEFEIILDDLKRELSAHERFVFEKHFLIVSANDDNKEGDYPNDVSSYHKMVTKVDISDMTAQDLHWQGTSFASPRVAGYISSAADEYKMKVVDVLQYVREATQKAPNNIITYELLISEINKAPQEAENSVIINDNEDIAADLIGEVIYEPSSNGYFPEDWRWKIEQGEVLGVEVKERKSDEYGNEKILVLAHLHRGATKIDAQMVLNYSPNGYAKELKSSKVKKIIIPKQQDYSQYVRLKKDYDFFPSLVLYNKSDMTLFVGGDYSSGEERKLFAGVFEPHSSKTVAIGNIDSYHIHFAYLK